MPAARADVREVCFVHWPVDAGAMADRLPGALEPVEWDGTAWVSALGQRTRAGVDPLAARFEFPQLTLRTYVRPTTGAAAGEVGVHFLHVSAASRLATWGARVAYGVPYAHRRVTHERDEDGVAVSLDGTPVVDLTPRGEPDALAPDSTLGRLTERYRYYLADGRYGEIDHGPWPVLDATAAVDTDAILADRDLPTPVGAPLVAYSPGVDIQLTRRP